MNPRDLLALMAAVIFASHTDGEETVSERNLAATEAIDDASHLWRQVYQSFSSDCHPLKQD